MTGSYSPAVQEVFCQNGKHMVFKQGYGDTPSKVTTTNWRKEEYFDRGEQTNPQQAQQQMRMQPGQQEEQQQMQPQFQLGYSQPSRRTVEEAGKVRSHLIPGSGFMTVPLTSLDI